MVPGRQRCSSSSHSESPARFTCNSGEVSHHTQPIHMFGTETRGRHSVTQGNPASIVHGIWAQAALELPLWEQVSARTNQTTRSYARCMMNPGTCQNFFFYVRHGTLSEFISPVAWVGYFLAMGTTNVIQTVLALKLRHLKYFVKSGEIVTWCTLCFGCQIHGVGIKMT